MMRIEIKTKHKPELTVEGCKCLVPHLVQVNEEPPCVMIKLHPVSGVSPLLFFKGDEIKSFGTTASSLDNPIGRATHVKVIREFECGDSITIYGC